MNVGRLPWQASYLSSNMKLFSIVRQFQLVQDEEHQSHQHSDYTCEYHSRKLDASELYGYAGKPSHKNNGGHCHVSGFPVIYLCLYKDADTGCTDHSVQEEGNTTDNRPRDRTDQGRHFPDK